MGLRGSEPSECHPLGAPGSTHLCLFIMCKWMEDRRSLVQPCGHGLLCVRFSSDRTVLAGPEGPEGEEQQISAPGPPVWNSCVLLCPAPLWSVEGDISGCPVGLNSASCRDSVSPWILAETTMKTSLCTHATAGPHTDTPGRPSKAHKS